jgi:hypothetical protein
MPLMAAGTAQFGSSPTRRAALTRRVQWLVVAIIGYNLIEATIAIAAGTVASSTALIGFGLDSIIEVSCAAAVAWQFATRDPQRHEKTTLRIIAVSCFTLAVYVAVTAVRAPAGHGQAGPSSVGLALAGSALLVTPVLVSCNAVPLGSRAHAPRSPIPGRRCTHVSAVLLVQVCRGRLSR